MALAAVSGFALEQFTTIERAILPAILIGMVVALFVPAKGACPVNLSKPKAPSTSSTDP